MKPAAIVTALVSVLMAGPALGIGISFDVTSGGILEDAILIASANGNPPRQAVKLGDLNLSSVTGRVFNVPVDASATHWWLIGHQGSHVVYSSNLNLTGIDLYDVEPYDMASPLTWNIPANLDGYVNGTGYSFDWWATTVSNHHSHVALDGGASSLWRFSAGGLLGRIAVNLHSNVPPVLALPGDANHDGVVDDRDLNILLSHWAESGDWEDGDFDGSGSIGDRDLNILLSHWGSTGSAPAVVPEPASLTLLALAGALGAIRSRRPRHRP